MGGLNLSREEPCSHVADHYDTGYVNIKSQDVFSEFSSFFILFLALKTQRET